MRWTDQLVAIATKASHVAAKQRSARVKFKYRKLLDMERLTHMDVSAAGFPNAHEVLRVLEGNGFIERVEVIPRHTVYRKAK